MKYEQKITEVYGYEIVARTDADLSDTEKKVKFDIVTQRIKTILQQIELHEDYDDLLKDRAKLNTIQDLLIDRMTEDGDKKISLDKEIEPEKYEPIPWE